MAECKKWWLTICSRKGNHPADSFESNIHRKAHNLRLRIWTAWYMRRGVPDTSTECVSTSFLKSPKNKVGLCTHQASLSIWAFVANVREKRTQPVSLPLALAISPSFIRIRPGHLAILGGRLRTQRSHIRSP